MSAVDIAILPGELSIPVVATLLEAPRVDIARRVNNRTLPAEYSLSKSALVYSPILQRQLSFSMKLILLETANIGEFFSLKLALNALTVDILSLEVEVSSPFPTFPMHMPAHELPIVTLSLSDERALPVGLVILEETVVVETVPKQLPIAFP